MKINKTTKVSTDNFMTVDGIEYMKYHKHRDDSVMCQLPDDYAGNICESCPLWDNCGTQEFYDVWRRVSKLCNKR